MLPPLGQTHAWLDRLHGVEPNRFEWLQREWASEDFYAATRQLEALLQETRQRLSDYDELVALCTKQAEQITAYQRALATSRTYDRRKIGMPVDEPPPVREMPAISGGTTLPQRLAHPPGTAGGTATWLHSMRRRRP